MGVPAVVVEQEERARLAAGNKAEVSPAKCEPVFDGRFGHLLLALLTICEGLGIDVKGMGDGLD